MPLQPNDRITSSVMSTYGSETSGPSMWTVVSTLRQRGRHQQARSETGWRGRPSTCRLPPRRPVAFITIGGQPLSRLALDVDAELTQRIDERPDRPFAHAGVAVEPISAVAQRAHGRQKANAGAAVRQVQVGVRAGSRCGRES